MLAQPGEEQRLDRSAQVQREHRHPGRAGVGEVAQQGVEVRAVVGQPGQDRRDHHPARQPGLPDRADRGRAAPAASGCRAPRPAAAPRPRSPARRRSRPEPCAATSREQRQVTAQQRALGQDGQRRAAVRERLDDPGHEPVPALDPLVRVGVGAERDVLTRPRRPRELGPQHVDDVRLDDDLRLEVPAGVQVQVLVRRPGEAVACRRGGSPASGSPSSGTACATPRAPCSARSCR